MIIVNYECSTVVLIITITTIIYVIQVHSKSIRSKLEANWKQLEANWKQLEANWIC